MAVLTPTLIAALLLPPAMRALVTPPLFVADPPLAPNAARKSSLKLPAVAVLLTVSTWLPLPPTRWLAMLIGLGAVLPTAAL